MSVLAHSGRIGFPRARQGKGAEDRDFGSRPLFSSNLLGQTRHFPLGVVLGPFLLSKWVADSYSEGFLTILFYHILPWIQEIVFYITLYKGRVRAALAGFERRFSQPVPS